MIGRAPATLVREFQTFPKKRDRMVLAIRNMRKDATPAHLQHARFNYERNGENRYLKHGCLLKRAFSWLKVTS